MTSNFMSRIRIFQLFAVLNIWSFSVAAFAQPDPNWVDHDRMRPQPPVIQPGAPSTQDRAGAPPSDAVVLFDGTNMSGWAELNGNATRWFATNGWMQPARGAGDVRTLQNFGDCQLHAEWASPVPARGEGQGRGNSGVFFGFNRYEVQVLDSYQNPTYADGGAAAIYGQYPPLVNASLPPGQWQTYDIIYTAPRFDDAGKLLSPSRLTVFHNGVLAQNNVELTGPTSWLERAPYTPHPVKTPIVLQDHGNAVHFRNIWVRELGKPGRPEFTWPESLLKTYVGSYGSGNRVDVSLENGQLIARFENVRFVMFAESKARFFAKTTDFQIEFQPDTQGQVNSLVWSVGEGANTARRIR
jgi:hypothetical protein